MILESHFKKLAEEKMEVLKQRRTKEVEAITEIISVISEDEELGTYQINNLLLLLEDVEVKGKQEVMIFANLIQMLNNELTSAQSKEVETDD